MTKLIDIEGIGPTQAEKLVAAGFKTVESLLENGKTAQGRKGIESATGINGKLILRWVNMADLFRIKGVGEEFADLLEAVGVDTVAELAQRNAANLRQKMVEANEAKKMVRALPSESQVEGWIRQAKELPRMVSH